VSCFLDLDKRIEDDELAVPNESEKCEHYEEEMNLLENLHGQNVKNNQRLKSIGNCMYPGCFLLSRTTPCI